MQLNIMLDEVALPQTVSWFLRKTKLLAVKAVICRPFLSVVSLFNPV